MAPRSALSQLLMMVKRLTDGRVFITRRRLLSSSVARSSRDWRRRREILLAGAGRQFTAVTLQATSNRRLFIPPSVDHHHCCCCCSRTTARASHLPSSPHQQSSRERNKTDDSYGVWLSLPGRIRTPCRSRCQRRMRSFYTPLLSVVARFRSLCKTVRHSSAIASCFLFPAVFFLRHLAPCYSTSIFAFF